MRTRAFLLGIALIVGVWLLITVALAAEAAHGSLHPADPPRPQATPRAEAINCHRREPPTQSPWLAVARADAQRYQLDILTFTWKIWQESGFNPNVHDSSAGAIGIAQFEPDTARGMGIDPHDPRQALLASARLDAGHLKQYARAAQALAAHYGGNEARYAYGLALAAYNAGTQATSAVWDHAYA